MAPSNTNLWESSNFCLSLFPTTKIKPWTLMAGGGVHIHRSKVVGPTRQKMIQSCVNGSQVIPASALSAPLLSTPRTCNEQKPRIVRGFVVKSDGFSLNSILKGCQKCGGKGAIECPGCKGTGKNKKNGNIFERWKCFDCQGFGLKSCPSCGKGGLTPEQRGER